MTSHVDSKQMDHLLDENPPPPRASSPPPPPEASGSSRRRAGLRKLRQLLAVEGTLVLGLYSPEAPDKTTDVANPPRLVFGFFPPFLFSRNERVWLFLASCLLLFLRNAHVG